MGVEETKKQRVRSCYEKGMDKDECYEHTKIARTYIHVLYEDWTFHQMKKLTQNTTEREMQISAIEEELFSLLEGFKNPSINKRIDNLTAIYTKYLVQR